MTMSLMTENILAETYFDQIPISKMFVAAYGRNSSATIVKKLVQNFQLNAVGTLYLSYREDTDNYAIIDGHHRMLAATECGITTLPARIYLGLTYEQEARLYNLFATVNKQMAMDRFRALIEAQDELAIRIKNMAESFDLIIDFRGPTRKGVSAMYTIYNIINVYDFDLLTEIFALLHEAYQTQTEAYSGPMLKGVAAFWSRYRNVADRQRVVNTLSKGDAKAFLLRASGVKQLLTFSESSQYVGVYLLESYNNGLRTNKLPAWKSRKTYKPRETKLEVV